MKNLLTATNYTVGEAFTKTFAFNAQSVKHFATLAGDSSPLHHDDEFASKSRFGGLIVSGTHYSALMMGMVGSYLTERGSGLGLEFNFQFRRAVLANDTVTAHWVIKEVAHTSKLGGDLVTLHGELRNSIGDICVVADSKSLVMPHESI